MTALQLSFNQWFSAWCLSVAGPTVAQREVLFSFDYLSILFVLSEHVCELGNITISCAHSPNSTLYITCANYGRTSNDTCYDRSATSTECIGRNSLLIATGLCQNHVSCTVVANNAVFGEPCSGVSKYLELGYECRESGRFTVLQIIGNIQLHYI